MVTIATSVGVKDIRCDDDPCSSESGEDDEDKEMGELGEEFGQLGREKELDRNMWAPEDDKEQEVGVAYGFHGVK